MPKGMLQGQNDYGEFWYGGPCPPEGHWLHQYVFTVHALKTEELWIDANSSAALISYCINSETIEKASIVSYYQR
jgi:Raf kinase inhibitor-like YbhB/YbcL family protein